GVLHLAEIGANRLSGLTEAAGQVGLADLEHARIPPCVKTDVEEQLERAIGENRQCVLDFGAGGKPAPGILQSQMRRVHEVSSFPEFCWELLRLVFSGEETGSFSGRIVSPLSSILWLLDSMRSTIASASVGLPIRSCQESVGN